MTRLLPLMKPWRWLAHLPLAMLPFLAAAVIEGPRLSPMVERGVRQNLAGLGLGWAKIEADGRDIVIQGVAPNGKDAEAAARAAASSPGVRRVERRFGIAP